jgi:branched-chain amino acid transport system ATP-binding protein
MSETLMRVRDLSVAYGKIEVLHKVSLHVDAGSIVSVIGPNGAGKTTLLTAIIGLLPSYGIIEYQGKTVDGIAVERRVAQGMILVPERRELFSSMSVEDNLLLGAFTHRHGLRQESGDYAAHLAEVFQLFPRLRERRVQEAGTLSGGERQMLALGRALMGRPKLLMLDEPSLGLAPQIVREIFRTIAALRSSGVSILLIEQNARAALQIADYAYVLETGDLALEGPAAELIHNPRVISSYLGLPGADSAGGSSASA